MNQTGEEMMKTLAETLTALETQLLAVKDSLLELQKIVITPRVELEVKDSDLVSFLDITDGYINQMIHLSLVGWKIQLIGIVKDAQKYRLIRDHLEIMAPEKPDDAE